MKNDQEIKQNKCQFHVFSFKSITKQRRINLNASMTMCKAKNSKRKNKKTKCTCYQGATLNKDKCHATPTFILPSQKIEYLQNTKEFVRDHDRRVKQYQEISQEIYVPKPKTKTMHCNVCRINYQDYLQHINSSLHKKHINQSNFNKYILELQDKYKQLHPKSENNINNDTGTYTDGDSDVQIIAVSGRKKIKSTHDNFIPNQYQRRNQSYTLGPMIQNYPFLNHPLTTLQILENCRQILNPYSACNVNRLGYGPIYPYQLNQNGMNFGLYCMGMPYNQISLGLLNRQQLF